MFPKYERSFLIVILLAITFKTASSINCYQCSGTDPNNPFQCNEFLNDDDPDLTPTDCDNVFGANYCIKHVGRFEVRTIKCFQCDSTKSIDCSDMLINEPDNTFVPELCDDVFEAQYCVKSYALRGGIGTIRYCSALDLGNYCNYVQHRGDELEYRSCVFTCGTDGCNSSGSVTPMRAFLAVSLLSLFCLSKKLTS